MRPIYDAVHLRKWDEFTMKHTPISSIGLMEKAALGCAKQILANYHFSSISIVCGKGNNGGDGLAIARMIAERGFKVTVHILNYTTNESENFTVNRKRLSDSIEIIEHVNEENFKIVADVLVDCIFGTGLTRPITGWLSDIIRNMNEAEAIKLAIDIPSGLFAQSNGINTDLSIFRADATFTIGAYKIPFFHADYQQFYGAVKLVPIDLLEGFSAAPLAQLIEKEDIKLRNRKHYAYKNNHGFLTVIGGMENMVGAAILAAESAFKTGCGYVGVIASDKIISPLASRLPEAIYLGEHFNSNAKKSTAIAIGPGLGTGTNSISILKSSISSGLPLIIDADGINLLADNPDLLKALPANSILTPHIGELHKLLGQSFSDEERLAKQQELSVEYNVYIIQKGAFSKLSCPDGKVYINPTGNPAMATAGMGDALTGIIGSFLAQGYSPFEAANNGVYCHGLAGDQAVHENGSRGILTSDLIENLPAALNRF
jgi:hydroxyethylthiazole kinase-like uncharacterized protein yjeF